MDKIKFHFEITSRLKLKVIDAYVYGYIERMEELNLVGTKSFKDIADDLKVSSMSIKRSVKRLKEKGLISVNRGTKNSYKTLIKL